MEASATASTSAGSTACGLPAAAFTNLGRDHMDYHPTVEDYLQAKMRLVRHAAAEGRAGGDLCRRRVVGSWRSRSPTAPGVDVLTVGRKGDFLALKRVEHERFRQRRRSSTAARSIEIDLPLAGDFQIANALVAAGLAIATGTAAGDGA